MSEEFRSVDLGPDRSHMVRARAIIYFDSSGDVVSTITIPKATDVSSPSCVRECWPDGATRAMCISKWDGRSYLNPKLPGMSAILFNGRPA